MIDYRTIETLIVNGLQDWLTSQGYNCPVVLANQVSPIPNYPYISYTITSPLVSNDKGYCVASDGTKYKPVTQIWSFTVQSDDDVEAPTVAMQAYDWFTVTGLEYLGDNGISVQRVGNINNRDNLLTIEYEHRNGFDVTFLLINSVSDNTGTIEEVITTANREDIIDVIKEV